MNYSKTVIVGRVTHDPQARATANGQSVVTMSVAVNRAWTDKDKKKHEETEYHNVVAWGRLAETAEKYLRKGSTLLVEGRLQTRGYEDKDGVTRKVTEIVASEIQFGPRPAKPEGETATKSEPEQGQAVSLDDENEEDTNRSFTPVFEEEEIKPEDIPF